MRGQKENICLDIIIESVFYRKDGKPNQDFNGKTFKEVSEKQFLDGYLHYSYLDTKKSFGLTEEDTKQFLNCLRKLQANPNLNDFPDFIFDNGFIEHFQITSSKETRKGATETKEQNQFYKKVEIETEQFKEECERIPSFDKVRSKSWERENCEHSYSNLLESFKRNFEHHIESLDKYSGNKDIGIFIIENAEFALSMLENVYVDWIDGMSSGDMLEQQIFNCYRISRDKNVLNYIYGFKDKIKYIIYVYEGQEEVKNSANSICTEYVQKKNYEVIKVDSIPYILKLLPWEFEIYPMYVKSVSSIYNISKKIK